MSPAPPFLSRALPASIFIVLSLVCFYLMGIISLIIDFPSPTATGFIEWPNGKIPILEKFHWLSFLDVVIRDVTVGFAPSSFGYDDVSRWQMMNFLMDPRVFYVIWGFESLRRGVTSGPAYYPGVFALIAQFGGGGVIIPIYYFAYLAYTNPLRSRSTSERKIDVKGSAIWALLIVLFSVVPVIGLMFDATFEARHWWTWLWQLYSVRITLSWYAIAFLAKLIPFPAISNKMSYRAKIALILAPFIGLAAGMWIYTLLYCPHPLYTVFLPQPLVLDTWVLRMRRILQFDQLFVFGSSVLWVAMDSRRTGIASGFEILAISVVLTFAFGTGASFGLVWLWREWQLVCEDEREEAKVK
ncbi:hypothetical protein N0V90_005083 [Kalmusia sp. IMI 367209]|nr:hypothetical protein N0V90_005083 [Kalmusia sp. IMI 367209]